MSSSEEIHEYVEAPEELGGERPRLRIQADDLSERWVARVHEHLAALEDPQADVVPGAAA